MDIDEDGVGFEAFTWRLATAVATACTDSNWMMNSAPKVACPLPVVYERHLATNRKRKTRIHASYGHRATQSGVLPWARR